MTAPRKGDKVRVTYEAEWLCTWTPDDSFQGYARADDGYQVQVPTGATVEPLEDLRPGDVYRDKDGDIGVYVGDEEHPWILLSIFGKVRRGGVTEQCADKIVSRPLTLLVRDGRPVTP